MRKYRFVVAFDVRSNEILAAYRKLSRFLSKLPFGITAHITEEAYWPSGAKIQPRIMKDTHNRFVREQGK